MAGFRDLKYFQAAGVEPRLTAVLEKHGFKAARALPTRGNDVLLIQHDAWRIPDPDRSDKAVVVQLTAWRPGEVRLEAQLDPYEPSLHLKPASCKLRATSLAIREQLLLALRQKVMAPGAVPEHLGANTLHIGGKLRPNSTGAVKFEQQVVGQPTAESFAGFIAEVIEAIIPLVHAVLSECGSAKLRGVLESGPAVAARP